jgi:DNA-binding beta-propeller fold protein YncE
MCKRISFALVPVLLAAWSAAPAQAAIIFATELKNNGGELVRVDTSTNTVTTVGNVSGPDSLIFDTNGNIVYSQVFIGQVSTFNPNTMTNTVLATGLSIPQDLALEPSGNTVLISDTGNARVLRQSLSGGPFSVLASGLVGPVGITYDNTGKLFLLTSGDNKIRQLDPTTGATLNSLTLPGSGLDGLTFDPVTGNLWAAEGGNLIEIPTNLSTSTVHTPIGYTGSTDGLESDGMGHIFLASPVDQHIWQYNIVGNTATQLTLVPTLDDVAPLVGLGAGGGTVPEPTSLALFGLGTVALACWRLRRKP